jgi:uncharacterized membrane protein
MRTKHFLQQIDHDRVVAAIAAAEAKTSGQVRVFIQRGHLSDPLGAAWRQFRKLGMDKTRERNAVLIFVAPRDQQLAVIGDDGVHSKCGEPFWQRLVGEMAAHFRKQAFTEALIEAIDDAGNLLAQYFPKKAGARNELPDEIIEG